MRNIINFVIFVLLAGCAVKTTIPNKENNEKYTEIEMHAKVHPEMHILTNSGDEYHTKPLVLRNDILIVLPHPYWNVESVQIHIDKIDELRLPGVKMTRNSCAHIGAITSFICAGMWGLFTGNYDEDYAASLMGAGLAGILGGCIGCTAGNIIDPYTRSVYIFRDMTRLEKIDVLTHIMGH